VGRTQQWNFDALTVNFKHTKTDQQGDSKQKKRHLFSNVLEYYIDLPFIMGLYFSSCFSFGQTRCQRIFPGGSKSQAKRMSTTLFQVLKKHKQEVLNMGYNSIKDIGIHSIGRGRHHILHPYLVVQLCCNMPSRRLNDGPSE
jgi:hypothetical protein